MSHEFKISPDHDFEAPGEILHKIHIENEDWFLSYNEGSDNFESPMQQILAAPPQQPGHPMHDLHEFINSDTTLDLMRTLTQEPAVRKADSYASLYAPGHFLTAHDDRHSSHDRVAAFVFSMTRNWNMNWGGHLAFYDDAGNITDALIPSFNTLNIFLIPQMHAVQLVSPFAGGNRPSYLGRLHR